MQSKDRQTVAWIAWHDVQGDLAQRDHRSGERSDQAHAQALSVTRRRERATAGLHDDKHRTHRGQEHPIALEHAQRTRELAFDKLDEERT